MPTLASDDFSQAVVDPVRNGWSAVRHRRDRFGMASDAHPTPANHEFRPGQCNSVVGADQSSDELGKRLVIRAVRAVSYTHLTLPTILRV